MSASLPRLHVETWAPEFGAPLEPYEMPSAGAGEIDTAAELNKWRPIRGGDDSDVATVAFVDGVRRVDARLTLDDPYAGPIPGVCGSYAVGAVVWNRREGASEITDVNVQRLALLSEGHERELPPMGPNLRFRTEKVDDEEPGALIQHLQQQMRNEEGRLAVELAKAGHLVIADGPIKALGSENVIGCIKRHRRSYLKGKEARVVAALQPGERTPLFTFDVEDYQRYSWYVRLDDVVGGHSWSGIMRCEVMESLPLPEVRRLADRSSTLLPKVASAQHLDPRAPQNLAPIAALERHLKRMLGDPGLVYRGLLAGLHGA